MGMGRGARHRCGGRRYSYADLIVGVPSGETDRVQVCEGKVGELGLDREHMGSRAGSGMDGAEGRRGPIPTLLSHMSSILRSESGRCMPRRFERDPTIPYLAQRNPVLPSP